ncbi:hypothetical protein Tco_0595257 [Tanacetum coccineum]
MGGGFGEDKGGGGWGDRISLQGFRIQEKSRLRIRGKDAVIYYNMSGMGTFCLCTGMEEAVYTTSRGGCLREVVDDGIMSQLYCLHGRRTYCEVTNRQEDTRLTMSGEEDSEVIESIELTHLLEGSDGGSRSLFDVWSNGWRGKIVEFCIKMEDSLWGVLGDCESFRDGGGVSSATIEVCYTAGCTQSLEQQSLLFITLDDTFTQGVCSYIISEHTLLNLCRDADRAWHVCAHIDERHVRVECVDSDIHSLVGVARSEGNGGGVEVGVLDWELICRRGDSGLWDLILGGGEGMVNLGGNGIVLVELICGWGIVELMLCDLSNVGWDFRRELGWYDGVRLLRLEVIWGILLVRILGWSGWGIWEGEVNIGRFGKWMRVVIEFVERFKLMPTADHADVKIKEEVTFRKCSFLEIDWLAGLQRNNESRQYQHKG